MRVVIFVKLWKYSRDWYYIIIWWDIYDILRLFLRLCLKEERKETEARLNVSFILWKWIYIAKENAKVWFVLWLLQSSPLYCYWVIRFDLWFKLLSFTLEHYNNEMIRKNQSKNRPKTFPSMIKRNSYTLIEEYKKYVMCCKYSFQLLKTHVFGLDFAFQ